MLLLIPCLFIFLKNVFLFMATYLQSKENWYVKKKIMNAMLGKMTILILFGFENYIYDFTKFTNVINNPTKFCNFLHICKPIFARKETNKKMCLGLITLVMMGGGPYVLPFFYLFF